MDCQVLFVLLHFYLGSSLVVLNFYLNKGMSGVLVIELKQNNEVTVTLPGPGFPHLQLPLLNVPAPG